MHLNTKAIDEELWKNPCLQYLKIAGVYHKSENGEWLIVISKGQMVLHIYGGHMKEIKD